MDDNRSMPENPAAPVSGPTEDELLLKAYENSFTGTYRHSLDGKGRLVIPQCFREALGTTFCVAPSYNFKSIGLYPNLEWARVRDQYSKKGSMNPAVVEYLEMFDALSFRGQELDNQGRLLLPTQMREIMLGDEKEAVITGNNRHILVTSKSRFETKQTNFFANVPSIIEIMGQL